MQLHDGHNYVYVHNTGTRSQASVYRCVDHRAYGRFFRILKIEADAFEPGVFAIEARGEHTTIRASQKRKGIHPVFKSEVDAAVLGTAGPKKTLRMLNRQFAGRDDLFPSHGVGCQAEEGYLRQAQYRLPAGCSVQVSIRRRCRFLR
jgi:hypothetical protein